MKAVIPVKQKSSRCRNKNFRPFCGESSLLDVKVRQLLRVLPAYDVYIAGICTAAARAALEHGVRFLYCGPHTTEPDFGWSDLMVYVTQRLPGTDDVAWVCCTAPLFDEFAGVIDKWNAVCDRHDSLVAVSPATHYYIDASGRPVNFLYGQGHRWSQQLAMWHRVDWACSIASRATILKHRYVIGTTPYVYQAVGFQIDVDTEAEFDAARVLYAAQSRR